MLDKWKQLRADMNLFGNTEPEVELIGLTCPVTIEDECFIQPVTELRFVPDYKWSKSGIQSQISTAAVVSTGAIPKDQDKLIRNLIKLGHHTPLEAIQFNFHVSGISKACGAQLSRHRIGQGHVSSSRRYQEQGVSFVYPMLDNIEDEQDAKQAYILIQDTCQQAYANYIGLRKLGLKKGDARYVIPTASAQERVWWINARALRDFFRLRLALAAEAEVRRLSYMILNLVSSITPTLFEDIGCDY